MPVLLRIAARNLWEHKAKTLIIGIIIALGVIVLIVGNSLMDTATRGIKRAFIDNYTGHIMVHGLADGDVSLFGVQSPGGMEDTPIIPEYEQVYDYLKDLEGVEAITPQITGYASLAAPGFEGRSFSLLFGIEPATYRPMFDNINFTAGKDLKPGEEGIVISRDRLDSLIEAVKEETVEKTGEEADISLGIGDTIRLTSRGNAGIKIREIPIRGIYEYKLESEGVGVDLISYVDVQTLRALKGMTIGYLGDIELGDNEVALLESEKETDSFFDDSFKIFSDDSEESDSGEADGQEEFSEEALNSILGDTSDRTAALKLDTGSWNYLLLKTGSTREARGLLSKINSWLGTQGIAADAGNWEDAAGPFATTADVIRQVFNVAIIIVGIVSLIIMMNTLVVSVIERTAEIGTMRALGAQKFFVWQMFFYEIIVITLVFGAVGSLLAFGVIGVLNIIGIPATNVFLRVLFAGPALHPQISAKAVITALTAVLGIGLLAHIYPVQVALRVQPIRAMQNE